MSTAQPVLPPRNRGSEILNGIVGVGTVWAVLGSAAFISLGFPFTPLGYGTALAHTLLPTILVVGIAHEFLGHYATAEVYCGYEAVFLAYGKTLRITLGSLGVAIAAILLQVATGISAPSWLLLFLAVSPGAVLVSAYRGRRNCSPTIALMAPLLNFTTALGLWWLLYDGLPVLPSASMDIVEALPAYTLALSAVFALTNAIPFAYFDGAEAFWGGNLIHKIATIVVLIGSSGILISYAN